MQAAWTLMLLVVAGCHANTERPNIVFILADDLGYSDIGYHGGSGQMKTPVMDKLAHDGVKLENYYVQPLCSPTRSALLSGRLPIHTGMQHLAIFPAVPYGMPTELPTLPGELKKSGYDTHMLGKWHVGMYKKEFLPLNRGFDSFYGYYQGQEDYFNHTICASLNGSYCGVDLHNDTTPDFTKTGRYSAHIFAEEAIRKINIQSKKKSPMFMYLAFQNVHQPQQAPIEYEKPFAFIKNKQRRTLAAQVAILDEAIGNITQALKDTGMWDNTVIIFSSDNGGMVPPAGGVGCNYPLRGGKITVWEGGVKVAGFVSGPLVPNPSTVSRNMMHITDWFPTIMRLAGGSVSNLTLDGFEQWDAINGKRASPRKEMLLQIDPLLKAPGIKHPGAKFDTRQQAALRMGDYKIVTGPSVLGGWYKPESVEYDLERWQMIDGSRDETLADGYMKAERMVEGIFQHAYLFNITADPYERNDLSRAKPKVLEFMLARLADYNAKMVPPLAPKADPYHADPAKHGGSWEPWM